MAYTNIPALTPTQFTDAFVKLQAHLHHSCAEVGCSRLDEAEERGNDLMERGVDEYYDSYEGGDY